MHTVHTERAGIRAAGVPHIPRNAIISASSGAKELIGGAAVGFISANISRSVSAFAAGSGEKMRKVGSKGAPTAKAFKKVQPEDREEEK